MYSLKILGSPIAVAMMEDNSEIKIKFNGDDTHKYITKTPTIILF